MKWSLYRKTALGLTVISLILNFACMFLINANIDNREALAYIACSIGLFGTFLSVLIRKSHKLCFKICEIILTSGLNTIYAIAAYKYIDNNIISGLFWTQVALVAFIQIFDYLDGIIGNEHKEPSLPFIRDDNIPIS